MMYVNYLRKVGCGWHAGHVVSWGMEGHASNASNATASGLAGSPTDHRTNDQAVFLAMIHTAEKERKGLIIANEF